MGTESTPVVEIGTYASMVSSGDHPIREHAVQFYSSDASLVAGLGDFIGAALGAGGPAIVLATRKHRKALAQKLRAHGLDLVLAANEGRYMALDASEFLSRFLRENVVDGELFFQQLIPIIERARAASLRDQPRIAIFGEMVALLWADGNTEGALRLEQLWNELSQKYSFSLFCAYSMADVRCEKNAGWFQKICDLHSGVIPTESYSALISDHEPLRAQRLQQELESRVAARTAELAVKNEQLLAEIKKRQGAEATLQVLSGRLLSVRDEERRRLARELHDGTAQLLATLAINLGVLDDQKRSLSARAAELVRQSSQVVEDLLQEVRGLSYILYPPTLDDMGLGSALPWYIERFQARTGVHVALELPPDLGRFLHKLEMAVFRIVQESLTNVHKHSGSSRADVRLSRDRINVVVEIQDHGRGMPARRRNGLGRAHGVGISGMRERVRHLGGSLSIHSDSSGTVVLAQIPLSGIPTVSTNDH